jgi:hypothetical protein
MNIMKRMWINQPSTLQPMHDLHGVNVLASVQPYTENTVIIYFLSGDIVSQVALKNCLSEGWTYPNEDNDEEV